MSTRARSILVGFAIVIGAGVTLAPHQRVDACGPDFPTNMLIRRADALATMWDGSFDEEVRTLVPVSAMDRELFQQSPAVVVAMAREQALYTAAAEKFHASDFDEAARGFEQLLRLPPHQRQRLSVAAAYSLGRARYAAYEDVKAIAAFRQVRQLVRAGFVDDQQLAISSLGEEARVVARHDSTETRADYRNAVKLYAQQAAHGDATGVTSLLTVVRRLDAADRAVLYRDDVGTALLALSSTRATPRSPTRTGPCGSASSRRRSRLARAVRRSWQRRAIATASGQRPPRTRASRARRSPRG